MFIRFLDLLGGLSARESALLCVLVTIGFYAAIFRAFLGVWSSERYDLPCWEQMRDKHMGKRTLMRKGSLYIEGMGLTIVSDRTH